MKVVNQLQLHVEWDEDEWVATEPETGMFGEGDTPTEALDDLVVSLGRLRDELRANVGNLGSGLAENLAFLEASLTWTTNAVAA